MLGLIEEEEDGLMLGLIEEEEDGLILVLTEGLRLALELGETLDDTEGE